MFVFSGAVPVNFDILFDHITTQITLKIILNNRRIAGIGACEMIVFVQRNSGIYHSLSLSDLVAPVMKKTENNGDVNKRHKTRHRGFSQKIYFREEKFRDKHHSQEKRRNADPFENVFAANFGPAFPALLTGQ